MYPDGARRPSAERQPRFPRAGAGAAATACMCHGCVLRDLRDPPDPRGRRHRDGPPAPGPRPPGARRAEGQRSPQRRPVFAAPGPYPDLPGYLSPARWDPRDSWGPWERRGPAPRPPHSAGAGGAPERPVMAARHYASVPEQCGCLSRADVFNGGPPQALPPPPPEVRGQGDSRRGSAGCAAVGEVGEQEEESGGAGAGPDRRGAAPGRPRSPPGYPHVANGHPGRRGRSETGDRGARTEEVGYGSPAASPRGGFFATEVPQKHLSRGRWTGPRAASSVSCGGPPGPERPRGRGAGTVHDQIRQVVSNLEDVLGGLKQVHSEMKEVVDHIDRLTANMNLGDEEESLAVTPVDEPAVCRFPPRPADLGPAAAAATPHHRPPPLQNHVFLRTNAPSPVHVASVVKTNRVPPPSGQAWDGTGRKAALPVSNGHLPHLCPPRYSDLQDPWRRAPDPEAGNSAAPRSPGPRTQKPPPYPQNGRCGKGPAPPPPVPVKTQTPYPGRRRQNTSMV